MAEHRAEWTPGPGDSVRASIRDVDTKRIIEHVALQPRQWDERVVAAAAAAAGAAVAAAGSTLVLVRKRRAHRAELARIEDRLAQAHAAQAAADAGEGEPPDLTEVADLERRREQLRGHRPSQAAG